MSDSDVLSDPANETRSGWYSNHAATFGDRIAAGRETLGLSQEDLAKKLGVKLRTIQSWEDDLAEPRANKLQMLAGVMNVSLMWLLNGEGDGVADPEADGALSRDITGLLTEIREIKGSITQAADKLGGLEKRLRRALKDQA
ncbi:MAG: helix-turn-helix domain-containing protein [Rhodobacter sp.]|jgi:ribosome-binding protein aMBF1 (putative translation factor)|nr:helix-turn-helix domain-containing protein [Rhodobacter sp.]